ncbi:MAG TPA: hypothetical protein VF171_00350 [Trueperaceae bacterium]
MDYDAEGVQNQESCPKCGSTDTVTYVYQEGFTELECRACGYSSEAGDIADLTRFDSALLEQDALPPVPVKKIKA